MSAGIIDPLTALLHTSDALQTMSGWRQRFGDRLNNLQPGDHVAIHAALGPSEKRYGRLVETVPGTNEYTTQWLIEHADGTSTFWSNCKIVVVLTSGAELLAYMYGDKQCTQEVVAANAAWVAEARVRHAESLGASPTAPEPFAALTITKKEASDVPI